MIKILDTLYHDRDYARFFVLETIARVPYFGKYSSFVCLYFFSYLKRILCCMYKTSLSNKRVKVHVLEEEVIYTSHMYCVGNFVLVCQKTQNM